MSEVSIAEGKLSSNWPVVRLAYSAAISSGVAWLLYQNLSTEQGHPWLLSTGAGFLFCMTMVWVILLRSPVIKKGQYTGTKEGHELIDWHRATKVSTQAFFVATLLVTFTPGQFDSSFTTILAGVMQAARLASIFCLVRVRTFPQTRQMLTEHPGTLRFRCRLRHQSASCAGNGPRIINARPELSVHSCFCIHISDCNLCHIYAPFWKNSHMGFMSHHGGASPSFCCVDAASA